MDIGFAIIVGDFKTVLRPQKMRKVVVWYINLTHLEELYAITQDVKVGDIEMLAKAIEFGTHHLIASVLEVIVRQKLFVSLVFDDRFRRRDKGSWFF